MAAPLPFFHPVDCANRTAGCQPGHTYYLGALNEFLAPLDFSILSQHRVSAPYGMAGGGDGAVGRQVIVSADGSRRELEGIEGCEVAFGDRLILETPGGGGWSAPTSG